MPDDGGGPWTVHPFDGAHVEWRRRRARPEEVALGTEFVVEISIDGNPSAVERDFSPLLNAEHEIEYRVRQLLAGAEGD